MDSTLISTKSGKTFATDENDWAPWNEAVKKKFQSMSGGTWIVIFTNQQAVSKGKVSIDTLNKKFKAVIDYYGIESNVAIYILTEKDRYRKPHTHVWDFFVQNHKGVNIDIQTSFYCGDAAGRKNDFSSTDRYFAHNIGIQFFTPEQFFLGYQMEPVVDPYESDIFKSSAVYDPMLINKIVGSNTTNKRLVVMTGMQGSGKSTLSAILEQSGYVVISKDKLKTKTQKEFDKAIIADKNIVIDCTNPDLESRKKWLECATGYTFVSVHVTTPVLICKHHNLLRVQLGLTEQPVPDIAYNIYNKKFVKPDKSEGFVELYEYPYVRNNTCKEYSYRYEID